MVETVVMAEMELLACLGWMVKPVLLAQMVHLEAQGQKEMTKQLLELRMIPKLPIMCMLNLAKKK